VLVARPVPVNVFGRTLNFVQSISHQADSETPGAKAAACPAILPAKRTIWHRTADLARTCSVGPGRSLEVARQLPFRAEPAASLAG